MKVIILSIIFFACPIMKSEGEYILIEHNGTIDKPFPLLVISTEKVELSKQSPNQSIEFVGTREFHYLLGQEAYRTIKDSIISVCKEHNDEDSFEYGSFDIICNNRSGIIFKYKVNIDGAKILFPKLITIIDSYNESEDLKLDLQSSYRRLMLE